MIKKLFLPILVTSFFAVHSLHAMRTAPAKVPPVTVNQIEYSAPLDQGMKEVIEARDPKNHTLLWRLILHENKAPTPKAGEPQIPYYAPFINSLRVWNQSLIVGDEVGRYFWVDTHKRSATRTVDVRDFALSDYQVFVANWDEKLPLFTARMQSHEDWNRAIQAAAVMGNKRPFAPDQAFWLKRELLLVAFIDGKNASNAYQIESVAYDEEKQLVRVNVVATEKTTITKDGARYKNTLAISMPLMKTTTVEVHHDGKCLSRFPGTSDPSESK